MRPADQTINLEKLSRVTESLYPYCQEVGQLKISAQARNGSAQPTPGEQFHGLRRAPTNRVAERKRDWAVFGTILAWLCPNLQVHEALGLSRTSRMA
jgi:hypothetical protein